MIGHGAQAGGGGPEREPIRARWRMLAVIVAIVGWLVFHLTRNPRAGSGMWWMVGGWALVAVGIAIGQFRDIRKQGHSPRTEPTSFTASESVSQSRQRRESERRRAWIGMLVFTCGAACWALLSLQSAYEWAGGPSLGALIAGLAPLAMGLWHLAKLWGRQAPLFPGSDEEDHSS